MSTPFKMKGITPLAKKVKTIKRGKYKGHTKEIYKKGDEGYAGRGRGVVIKDSRGVVVKTKGKGFRATRKTKRAVRKANA